MKLAQQYGGRGKNERGVILALGEQYVRIKWQNGEESDVVSTVHRASVAEGVEVVRRQLPLQLAYAETWMSCQVRFPLLVVVPLCI